MDDTISSTSTVLFDQVILITGRRDWTNDKTIYDVLHKWKGKRVCLIHGNCRGADRLADTVVKIFQFSVRQ